MTTNISHTYEVCPTSPLNDLSKIILRIIYGNTFTEII